MLGFHYKYLLKQMKRILNYSAGIELGNTRIWETEMGVPGNIGPLEKQEWMYRETLGTWEYGILET